MARLGVSLTLGAILLWGCGGGSKSPTAPSPPVTSTPSASAGPVLTSFTIGAADASVPGQNTGGVLTLSAPPTTAVVVNLSASDTQAVTVPASITIPVGAVTATVPILTRKVASDTNVAVTATLSGSSQTASVAVGSGSFFSFASSPGDSIGQGRSRRMSAADFALEALAGSTLSAVTVTTTARSGSATGSWTLSLSVPSGTELRPGFIYNGAVAPGSATSPGLRFTPVGGFCSSISGSFVILDLAFDTSNDTNQSRVLVNRIHAAFTQSCQGQPSVNGEVYLVR